MEGVREDIGNIDVSPSKSIIIERKNFLCLLSPWSIYIHMSLSLSSATTNFCLCVNTETDYTYDGWRCGGGGG